MRGKHRGDKERKPSAPQGMSDRQLRDEVITIFLAGYETVANALTWTWYLLSENPLAAERMQREIDEVLQGRLPTLEDVPRLRYTEMVFAESMRLYPPAWAMGRQSTQVIELGPYRLPAGTYFFFSQYILQRSEEFFPDPLRFDPERFTPEQKAVRPSIQLFPVRRRLAPMHRRGICVDGRCADPGDPGAAMELPHGSRPDGRCAAQNHFAPEISDDDDRQGTQRQFC